jgi:hypothetical protein
MLRLQEITFAIPARSRRDRMTITWYLIKVAWDMIRKGVATIRLKDVYFSQKQWEMN